MLPTPALLSLSTVGRIVSWSYPAQKWPKNVCLSKVFMMFFPSTRSPSCSNEAAWSTNARIPHSCSTTYALINSGVDLDWKTATESVKSRPFLLGGAVANAALGANAARGPSRSARRSMVYSAQLCSARPFDRCVEGLLIEVSRKKFNKVWVVHPTPIYCSSRSLVS